jgi:hypothetical protein
MRSLLIAAIAVVAVPAAAQPVTSPTACSVDVVRAPDDVRAVVDRWLAGAARCSVALEVRVVTTQDGLYVMARDDHGTVRDRVVPDAQTAGALIASWADDGQPPPIAMIDFHADVRLAPGIAMSPAPAVVDEGAGGVRPRHHHSVRELVLFGKGDSMFRGLRAEVDVVHHDGWTAGLAFTLGAESLSAANAMINETVHLSEYGATAYVAHPSHIGSWDFQPAVGIGLVHTTAFDDPAAFDPAMPWMTGNYYEHVTPVAEGSILASHDLVGSLGFSVGALVTMYNQHIGGTLLQDRGIEAVLVWGLRFGFL